MEVRYGGLDPLPDCLRDDGWGFLAWGHPNSLAFYEDGRLAAVARAEHGSYLQVLYVLAGHRRRGVGRAVVRLLAPQVVYGVLPDTADFWRRLGFADQGDGTFARADLADTADPANSAASP